MLWWLDIAVSQWILFPRMDQWYICILCNMPSNRTLYGNKSLCCNSIGFCIIGISRYSSIPCNICCFLHKSLSGWILLHCHHTDTLCSRYIFTRYDSNVCWPGSSINMFGLSTRDIFWSRSFCLQHMFISCIWKAIQPIRIII